VRTTRRPLCGGRPRRHEVSEPTRPAKDDGREWWKAATNAQRRQLGALARRLGHEVPRYINRRDAATLIGQWEAEV
jgi:hypothetical protein